VGRIEASNMKVLIVIPCYNEEASIGNIVRSVASLNVPGVTIHALPVNDCSTDNTLSEIKNNTQRFLDLPVNLGIGGTVQSGYKYASFHNYDVAIQLDGDGQHPIEELETLMRPLMNNECDVVIGSRFITGEGFQSSGLRRAGINYFKRLNQLLLGIKITDSTSGFRAINAKAIALACDYYPDEYPEPEAIVLFHMNGLKIKEVPVLMKERQGGTSSISSFGGVYYMVKVTLGIIFIYLKLKFYGKRSTV
jgi:glycosyltransferase involved in cell wall biosynthesis